MENEDYRIMAFRNTTLRCFRNGRIDTLSKKSKIEKWNRRTFNVNFGYLRVNIDKRLIMVHTIIALCFLGKKPIDLVIDHINGIRDDNRVVNLQYITKIENDRKRTKMNGKDIKGFTNRPNGKYESYICVNNKRLYLGMFDTEEDARKSYLDAKFKYHNVNL